MNLIDLWKKALPSQSLRRPNRESYAVGKYYMDFICAMDVNVTKKFGGSQTDLDLLSNDWEIVKEKKKVVIEGARIFLEDKGYYQTNDISNGFYQQLKRSSIPVETDLKITIEWEK